MRKFLATAMLAAGAVLAIAPAAHADDEADPTRFSDQTANFVNYQDPIAVQGQATANGKQIILSPYGVTHTIACRGNGTTVPLYDCKQQDDLGWIDLQLQNLPQLGLTWVYIP
jgi:hypothetical protein